MFEGILGIKKPTFGLDIGHKTLKVAQVKGCGKKARLISAAEVEIQKGVLTKDGITDKNKLAQQIVQAMKNAKPSHASAKIVSSALPESLVFTKIINLPKMKNEEINKNIPFQAKEFFPIPIEETYMDWQIVNNAKESKTTEVMVVAAPKVLVDSLIETVKIAGLELLGLETKPIAVTRALINPDDLGTYLIIDIGAETSGLACYDEKMVKLTSTVAVGGDKIQKDFYEALKILNSEIIHIIKYYQNRLGKVKNFNKILLAGGGANIEKIPETIQNLVKIKTEVGSPIVKLKSYNPIFATALGLALKEI